MRKRCDGQLLAKELELVIYLLQEILIYYSHFQKLSVKSHGKYYDAVMTTAPPLLKASISAVQHFGVYLKKMPNNVVT